MVEKIFRFIKRGLKNHGHIMAVFLLALLFFTGTAYYNSQVRPEGFVFWGSPDENANYVFTKLYGQTGRISIFEGYNLYVEDILHPRSIRSDWGELKPVSFLGIIIIYGKIVSVLGYKVIPYLTPFFASLGIIFYYLLIKKLFGRRNAFLSAFLLTGFPVYIYYSARSMFHNVLFLVLLLASLYFSYLMVEKSGQTKKKFFNLNLKNINWFTGVFAALGGYLLGLALMVRTSEALWLLPALGILWLFNFKKVGISKLLVFLSFTFIGWLPAGYWNQILFGHPIYSGYPEMNTSVAQIADSGQKLAGVIIPTNLAQIKQLLSQVKTNVFYFGLDPAKSASMFNYYFIRMFPWIFWPAVAGLFLRLRRIYSWKKRDFAYLSALIIASVILVLYYGSWEFFDNPDVTSRTIGNSYTRYWLPIYLGATPFASLFLIKLTRGLFPFGKWKLKWRGNLDWLRAKFENSGLRKQLELRSKFAVNGLRIIIVWGILIISLNFVLFGSEEGLYYNLANQKIGEMVYLEVMDKTEENSVIITTYYDKIFFPRRKVIVGDFSSPEINQRYAQVAEYLPLYYYNFSFDKEAIEYLNNRRLAEVGLSIDKIEKIGHNFCLYKLFKIAPLN